jgi:ubiquinone/menaquinone biosynthesis C-methylase UbiE
MQVATKKGHSEEYFHEERNHWYNTDFLDLMAKRWELNRHSSLLDIGSGLCHWSKLLVPYMQSGTSVTALDNDAKWAPGNKKIADYFTRHQASIDFIKGNAGMLPFEDESFDVVTCQTLLIHLQYPEKALKEMKRVVKKDGIVICAEPNNRIQSIIQDSSNYDDDIDRVLDRIKNTLAYEKLKLSNKNGNHSFGDLLTGTMNELGFKNIQSFLNDKLISIYPPYDTAEQQAAINIYLTWGQSDTDREAFEKRYHRALSNHGYTHFLKEFKSVFSSDKIVEELKSEKYTSSGAALMYLISGTKE